MKKTILSLIVASLLTGCATSSAIREKVTGEQFDPPTVERETFFTRPENQVTAPAGGPIPVAVYSFADKT